MSVKKTTLRMAQSLYPWVGPRWYILRILCHLFLDVFLRYYASMAQKEKGKSLASSFQFLRVQSTREGSRTAFLEVDIKKRLRCRKFHFLKLHLTLAEELRETKRKKASVNCTVLYKEYKVTFTPTPPPPLSLFPFSRHLHFPKCSQCILAVTFCFEAPPA